MTRHAAPVHPDAPPPLDEAVDRIEAATDPGALWRALAELMVRDGVTRLCYHLLPRPGTTGDRPVVATEGWPSDWLARYLGERMWRADPITDAARASDGPVAWRELRRVGRLSEREAEVFDFLLASGVIDGVAFQVFGPRMRNGVLGLALDHEAEAMARGKLLRFQVIGQAGHARLCALVEDRPPPKLSRREREVTDLIAMGKSNPEIATVFGVSPHTVDTQVRRIFDKLGVHDRTSAAIVAVVSGLVTPRVA